MSTIRETFQQNQAPVKGMGELLTGYHNQGILSLPTSCFRCVKFLLIHSDSTLLATISKIVILLPFTLFKMTVWNSFTWVVDKICCRKKAEVKDLPLETQPVEQKPTEEDIRVAEAVAAALEEFQRNSNHETSSQQNFSQNNTNLVTPRVDESTFSPVLRRRRQQNNLARPPVLLDTRLPYNHNNRNTRSNVRNSNSNSDNSPNAQNITNRGRNQETQVLMEVAPQRPLVNTVTETQSTQQGIPLQVSGSRSRASSGASTPVTNEDCDSPASSVVTEPTDNKSDT